MKQDFIRFILKHSAAARLTGARVIGIVVAGLNGCSFESPQSPTWDTDLTLPLIEHNYDMLELVDRIADDALSYDDTGYISFNINQEIDTVAVDAGLSIADLSTNFSEKLGLIEISGPPQVSDTIFLSEYHLAAGVVPAMTMDAASSFPLVSDVESATISSGSMIITATNNFGIPLDTVTVVIDDDMLSQQIGAVDFPDGLGVGETKSQTIDLSGKNISNSFSYNTHLYTPGDTILTLDNENNVEIEIGFSSPLTVSSAIAKIPAQQKAYDQNVSFTEDNDITSADIKDGSLALNITNRTNLPAEIDVTVAEFTSGGNPLNFSVSLPPQQNCVVTREINGYLLTPIAGQSQPTICVAMTVDIPGSGENHKQVASTDSFAVDITVSDLEFSSVNGVINPTVVEIDPITEPVDIPTGFDGFTFTNAEMTIEFYSAVNLPGSLSVHLQGDAGQQLDIIDEINPGTVGNPELTIINVGSDNLTAFLSPIPSEITITGDATIGDGVTSGSVTENDFFFGKVEISSPLVMSISEATFETDINEVDTDDLDEVTKRMNHAAIHVQLTNHLPFEASVMLYLGTDPDSSLFDNAELTIGPVHVNSGLLGANGTVGNEVVSVDTIELSNDEFQVFNNDLLYVGQEITFPGTDGQTVKIRSTDYIDVQAYIVASARIGDF